MIRITVGTVGGLRCFLLATITSVSISEAVRVRAEDDGLTCCVRESALLAGYEALLSQLHPPFRHSYAGMARLHGVVRGHAGSHPIVVGLQGRWEYQRIEVDYRILGPLTSAVARGSCLG